MDGWSSPETLLEIVYCTAASRASSTCLLSFLHLQLTSIILFLIITPAQRSQRFSPWILAGQAFFTFGPTHPAVFGEIRAPPVPGSECLVIIFCPVLSRGSTSQTLFHQLFILESPAVLFWPAHPSGRNFLDPNWSCWSPTAARVKLSLETRLFSFPLLLRDSGLPCNDPPRAQFVEFRIPAQRYVNNF